MQGRHAQGPGCSRSMARKEGQRNGIGGGDGVGETVSRAHASLAAILAFALGMLAMWAVPAMLRDARAWHDELWPRSRRGE